MTTPRHDPDQAFEILIRHAGYLAGQVHAAVTGLLANLPPAFDAGESRVSCALDILRHPPPTAANALQQTHAGALLLAHGWPRRRPRGSVRAAAGLAEFFSDAQTAALASLTLDSLRHWATLEDLPGEVQAGFESEAGHEHGPQGSTTLYRQGQSAFERLLGLHCLMGHIDPDTARDQVREIARSAVDAAGPRGAPETVPVRTISTSPPADPVIRRATRVLAMVHELHKAGYQRIRILPFLSPSGAYWRCLVTTSGNMEDDGYHIRDEWNPRLVARYTTGQDNRYFDWQGSENASARELAARFLREFPDIARGGQGRDWMYAGWLTDVLGRAESGGDDALLYLIADWEIPEEELRRWRPPPPPKDPTKP